MTDPSRLEAAEAGLHHEQDELAHGRAGHAHHPAPAARLEGDRQPDPKPDHVVAEDALPEPVPVVVATPPSGRALLAGAIAALLTLAAVVAFAVKISGA